MEGMNRLEGWVRTTINVAMRLRCGGLTDRYGEISSLKRLMKVLET